MGTSLPNPYDIILYVTKTLCESVIQNWWQKREFAYQFHIVGPDSFEQFLHLFAVSRLLYHIAVCAGLCRLLAFCPGSLQLSALQRVYGISSRLLWMTKTHFTIRHKTTHGKALYLFMYLIGVLRCTQEYFICMSGASIMVGIAKEKPTTMGRLLIDLPTYSRRGR